MSDTNDDMMNMNLDSGNPAGLYVSDEESMRIIALCDGFIKEGNKEHNRVCDGNKPCTGENPYVLAILKNHFILHPELDEMQRLAISSMLFYRMGRSDGNLDHEIKDSLGSLGDILKGMRTGSANNKQQSFKEFLDGFMKLEDND